MPTDPTRVVVQGYARGGHTVQVDALLAQGANLDAVLQGYVRGGRDATGNATQNIQQHTQNGVAFFRAADNSNDTEENVTQNSNDGPGNR